MGVVAKVFGSLFLILGLLLLLGGIAAAVYSATDEQDNQDGLLRDGERSDQNEALLVYGGVAAAAGLVILIIGVVLIAIGPKVVVAPADAAAPVVPGPPAAPEPRTPGSRGRHVAILAGSVLAVFLLAAWLVSGGAGAGDGSASAFGVFGGGSSDPLGSDVFEGTVAQGASAPFLGSTTNGDNDHDFQAPARTGRIVATVDWTPQATGAERLEVVVTSADGTELARQAGAPGFSFELAGDLDGAGLHYRVFPADFAGAVVEQPFTIGTEFWQ